MDDNIYTIIRLLNSLTHVSLDDFQNRLRLQKLAYLAREMGCNCGFAFDWYVRGPYSPSLTRALFAAQELEGLTMTNVKLNEEEAIISQNIRELVGKDMDDPRALELLASVWYFLPHFPISEEAMIYQIDRLIECKPQFSRKEIEQTFERIIKFREKRK